MVSSLSLNLALNKAGRSAKVLCQSSRVEKNPMIDTQPGKLDPAFNMIKAVRNRPANNFINTSRI